MRAVLAKRLSVELAFVLRRINYYDALHCLAGWC